MEQLLLVTGTVNSNNPLLHQFFKSDMIIFRYYYNKEEVQNYDKQRKSITDARTVEW